MGTSTFSGPILAGTVRQGPYENLGFAQLAVSFPITVTAVENTDFVVYLPAYATVMTINNFTATIFTGATATLSIGSAVGGAQYVNAQTIKAASTTISLASMNFVGAGLGSLTTPGSGLMSLPVDTAATAANNGIPTAALYFRVTQTTPTAVGASTVVVQYVQN
jgi:hypothetical protein